MLIKTNKEKTTQKKDTRADTVPLCVSPDVFVLFIQCDISIRFLPDRWGGLWYQKTPPSFAAQFFPPSWFCFEAS